MARKFFKTLGELYEKLAPKGMVPPQAIDLEESMIGAMLIDKSSATRAISIIGQRTEEDSPFYRETHTLIYMAALALYEKSEPIDLLTVKNEMLARGLQTTVSGESIVNYLVELTSKVVTTVNVESYARIILEKWVARELIRVCEEIKMRCYEGELDTLSMLDETVDELLRLSSLRSARSRPVRVSERVKATLELIERARDKDGVPGIATGYSKFDELTLGMAKGNQIVLAADTGAGKSAFAANIAYNVAYRKEGVVIFSSEMKDLEIYLRMLSRITGIDHDDLKSGIRRENPDRENELWREATKGMMQLGELPMWIDDTSNLTPIQIRARLRQVSARHPISLVVVDYLQLLTPSRPQETQNLAMASISKELKALWMDLDVPGIVLSQLAREGKKAKRRPEMYDLRDSGAIENDANDIWFLWNPDDQDIAKDMVELELIRRKARGGKIGTLKIWFDKKHQEFTEQAPFPTFEGPPGF